MKRNDVKHAKKGVRPIPKEKKGHGGEPREIYDRVFKRIFSLSHKAVVSLVNGIFQEDFPTDSTVTYHNREFVRKDLGKRFADIIMTIAGRRTFHMEAQMHSDATITVRMFEYGLLFAMDTQKESGILSFPCPAVIYLSRKRESPKESILRLKLGRQGEVGYRVRNYMYLSHSIAELNEKKMAALLPFQALRLCSLLEKWQGVEGKGGKPPSEDEVRALQEEVCRDIIGSIELNLRRGNITEDDARQLLEMSGLLYGHICKEFQEKGGTVEMNPLLPGAIELPNDKYRLRIDELEQEVSQYADEIQRYAGENARYADEVERLKKRILELESSQQPPEMMS